MFRFKKIISCVLIIAIIFSVSLTPALAADGDYHSSVIGYSDYCLAVLWDYGNSVIGSGYLESVFGTTVKGLAASLSDNVCSLSNDGLHATCQVTEVDWAYGEDSNGRYCNLRCDYCGKNFRCYSSDLIAAHDEYVASLDNTTAGTGIIATGFTAKGYMNSSWSDLCGFLGGLGWEDYMSEAISVFNSLGICNNVCVPYISEDGLYLYGYFWDEDGRLLIGKFDNPTGNFDLSLFGVYPFSSLNLVDSKLPLVYYYSSINNFPYVETSATIFYSKAHASSWHEAIKCIVFDGTNRCKKQGYSNYLFSSLTTFHVKPVDSSIWDDDAAYYTFSGRSAYSFTECVNLETLVWNSSIVVTQPTGTDNTTRTGSLMQTINNYNVDNSVVDNSSNVNYYIAPKSYVTELPDDTIDIEQCYSPQSYDEETLVFTEPVTGAQILSSGWTYNYETRTYDIAVPEGTTTDTLGSDITRIELIYGDEAVTYNYYLADDTLAQSDEYAYVMVSGDETFGTGGSSGDDNTGDDSTGDTEEETHKHSYTDTVTTEPTCEAPGIRKYTCDACGDSYTEKIDAAGHTWTVKQSVATQYDDTGAVTVQGYTIYKCSVCNTEYKDEAGTGPPNNSADNTDGEGIFKKIGQLLGSILSGLLGMIEAVLGGLLDGLVRLANLLGDKLTHVVEIVTGLFDKIPQLFGGFTALLGDVFVFIPEDIMTIFTFGAAAIVFVGILMLFIKR